MENPRGEHSGWTRREVRDIFVEGDSKRYNIKQDII